MRSSRAFDTPIALIAGALALAATLVWPTAGLSAERYMCPADREPIRSAVSEVAALIDTITTGIGDGLSVANVDPLTSERAAEANSRLQSLLRPVKLLSSAVAALTRQQCYEADPDALGMSPAYEFMTDRFVCDGIKAITTSHAGGAATLRSVLAPPQVAVAILFAGVACDAYQNLIRETLEWRFTKVDWKEIGWIVKDGQLCRLDVKPKIPRNFWCAVDVNRPEDPASVAYSMCNDVRYAECRPRDAGVMEGGGLGLRPDPGENVGGGVYPPVRGPASGARPDLPFPPYVPLPGGSTVEPTQAGMPGEIDFDAYHGITDEAFAADAQRAAEEAVEGVASRINQARLWDTLHRMREDGLGGEAETLERALSTLVLYGTLSAIYAKLANDPAALDRYNLSLDALREPSTPCKMPPSLSAPIRSGYAIPNVPEEAALDCDAWDALAPVPLPSAQ